MVGASSSPPVDASPSGVAVALGDAVAHPGAEVLGVGVPVAPGGPVGEAVGVSGGVEVGALSTPLLLDPIDVIAHASTIPSTEATVIFRGR